jgi:hypothetical protein
MECKGIKTSFIGQELNVETGLSREIGDPQRENDPDDGHHIHIDCPTVVLPAGSTLRRKAVHRFSRAHPWTDATLVDMASGSPLMTIQSDWVNQPVTIDHRMRTRRTKTYVGTNVDGIRG